jgi:hypothetical protein
VAMTNFIKSLKSRQSSLDSRSINESGFYPDAESSVVFLQIFFVQMHGRFSFYQPTVFIPAVILFASCIIS